MSSKLIWIDYTDRYGEEQLSHSLLEQTALAPEFIKEAWKKARQSVGHLKSFLSEGIEEIHITGCGDSYYAASSLEFAFTVWAKTLTRVGPALTVGRYRIPEIGEQKRRTLVIGISASGEIARTIEAIEIAKSLGALTMGFTSDPESSLATTADAFLSLPTPDLPHGPGLISYLGSLLMGYAICSLLTSDQSSEHISRSIEGVPVELERWMSEEQSRGRSFAKKIAGRENIVFLGSGPGRGSSMFSAAKIVESAGVSAWGQDVEEWAHIEYFSEPTTMPTWLLSAEGRSIGREREIETAARAIGRQLLVSRWSGWQGLDPRTREAISPLLLWAGPVAYAAELARILGEEPFRGFGGGRSHAEGGGASKIRSSERASSVKITEW